MKIVKYMMWLLMILIFLPNGFGEIREMTLDDDPDQYWYMHVPDNIEQGKKYPVIVAVHGAGGNRPWAKNFAKTWIVKGKTDNFISIAPAFEETGPRKNFWDLSTGTGDALVKMIKYVASNYKIDETGVFIQGFSGGGAFLLQFLMQKYHEVEDIFPIKGILWTSGNYHRGTWPRTLPKETRFFIEIGDQEFNYRGCPLKQEFDSAVGDAERLECYVETHIIEGQEHKISPKAKELAIAFILKTIEVSRKPKIDKIKRYIEQGSTFIEQKKYALAYEAFTRGAKVGIDVPEREESLKKADGVMRMVNEKIKEAQAFIDSRQYGKGYVLYETLEKEYRGLEQAKTVKQLMRKMKFDKTIKKALQAQLKEAKLEQLFKRAEELEKAGKKRNALVLYKKIVTAGLKYKYEVSKKSAAKVKSFTGKTYTASTAKSQKQAKVFWDLAQMMIEQGQESQGKRYMEDIIKKYPDTEYAEKARKKLNGL